MWLNGTPLGKSLSLFLNVLKWHLNILRHFLKKSVWKIRLPFTGTGEISYESKQSLSISFSFIIYSTQCTACWQPLLKRISPKNLSSPSVCFNVPFQITYLYKHSQPLPTLEIKCLIQGHFSSKGGKPSNHSFSPFWLHRCHIRQRLTSSQVEAATTPCCSSWQARRTLSLFFWSPWILHAVDILIRDSAYSAGSHVPSHQIQSCVSVPVLMEEMSLASHY